jgi:hypothetical protein
MSTAVRTKAELPADSADSVTLRRIAGLFRPYR